MTYIPPSWMYPAWPYMPYSFTPVATPIHAPFNPAHSGCWPSTPLPGSHTPAWPDPRAHTWPWNYGPPSPWIHTPHPSYHPWPGIADTDRMPRPMDFDAPPPLIDAPDPLAPPWFTSTPAAAPAPPIPMVPWGTPRMPGAALYGAGALPPPTPSPEHAEPIVFNTRYWRDLDHLPSRPPDWRRDYVPPNRRGPFSTLFRKTEKTLPGLEHRHLIYALLMPNERTPIMSLDLRAGELPLLDPLRLQPPSFELLATTAPREPNETDLLQLATVYPTHRIRLVHEDLPWYVDIFASTPNGVLVKDVLEQLIAFLNTPICPQDFYNREMNATDREWITEAYRARAAGRMELMQRGVMKVDYLGRDCILSGFSETRQRGTWFIKTRSIDKVLW
ncbi:hypothetical protein MKEN_00446100 [Mycena kentingensis (nom. inval.)]|nr:hypothetical protein MKEN_00446100 [Mycena kentingensis (nom. inval.)]